VAKKNAEIAQEIEKAHIKVCDERFLVNFIPRFLTLPHLVCFANISSPRGGEARLQRLPFRLAPAGRGKFAKRTR
jgi:hypothetical protein